MRKHFDQCEPSPPFSDEIVSILCKSTSIAKLLTLEALFINQIKPELNEKDEYRSRTLTLKF